MSVLKTNFQDKWWLMRTKKKYLQETKNYMVFESI